MTLNVAMVVGAAPAGHGTTARTREAAAACCVDTGEATNGERTRFAQGEGPSPHQLVTPVWNLLHVTHSAPVPLFLFQLVHGAALEAEISSLTLKLQWSEDDKMRLLRETEEQSNKVKSQTEAKILLPPFILLFAETTVSQQVQPACQNCPRLAWYCSRSGETSHHCGSLVM